ncbi:MAG: helix-turn-helix domain-containing protein [Solobacterium sp.]|nr:helix-turn-helix domain-containing protein [Solobacterium sp.]
MSLGENLYRIRKERKLSQEAVADALGVSFQAVSAWERDEYTPDTKHLISLAEYLDVSLSSLAEDQDRFFPVSQNIYDWEHMKTYVKTTAKANHMTNTLNALEFACKAHQGQTRKNSDIPYIYHPLNLACHCLAMDIREDAVIAACLLHDVIEDCGVTAGELPVEEEVKELVLLLTREKDHGTDRDEIMRKYIDQISGNPKAAMIKLLDRCNNITTMAWGLSRKRIYRTIRETETYILPLLDVIRQVPEYNNAAWLLKYQIVSTLDIYKRLL